MNAMETHSLSIPTLPFDLIPRYDLMKKVSIQCKSFMIFLEKFLRPLPSLSWQT